MKTIICIHGINTRTDDVAGMEKAWVDAIIESSGVGFPRKNITFVYWGNIAEEFDARSPFKSDGKYIQFADDVILDAMKSGRNAVPKARKKNWTATISSREDALSLFEALSLPIRKAMRDLAHDAYLYFYVDGFGEAVRGRLLDVLKKFQGSEIILLGHSLGSVICYDVLRKHEDSISIDILVTFGSPLGLGFVQPHLQEKRRRFQKNIRSQWINISDPIDFVATNHQIADNFKKDGKAVTDRTIVNSVKSSDGGRDAHNGLGYIRASEYGAILRELVG